MRSTIESRTLCAALAVTTALAGAAAAADWPRFRGPRLDGISEETGLLATWPEGGPPELWRVPLPAARSCGTTVSATSGRT
jgi:hypothetical protein